MSASAYRDRTANVNILRTLFIIFALKQNSGTICSTYPRGYAFIVGSRRGAKDVCSDCKGQEKASSATFHQHDHADDHDVCVVVERIPSGRGLDCAVCNNSVCCIRIRGTGCRHHCSVVHATGLQEGRWQMGIPHRVVRAGTVAARVCGADCVGAYGHQSARRTKRCSAAASQGIADEHHQCGVEVRCALHLRARHSSRPQIDTFGQDEQSEGCSRNGDHRKRRIDSARDDEQ